MYLEGNMWHKYKKFTSVVEARNWGETFYSYWLPKYQLGGILKENYETENPEKFLEGYFSQEELRKLRVDALENKWFSFYCGGNWGLAINEKSRYGCTHYLFSPKQLVEMQEIMDNRLNKSYVPENILGYRFLDYRKLCISTQKRYIHCGAVIEDKGYMGVGLVKSALEEEFGGYDTLLEIMIPQGTKGLYIDLISSRPNEQELLFSRGSRLKVLFTYKNRGKRVIICKMLKA